MQKPTHLSNKQKQKRSPADWDGLGNEPRNENLNRMRGPTSFEKDVVDQDKESGAVPLYRCNKNKGRDSGSG